MNLPLGRESEGLNSLIRWCPVSTALIRYYYRSLGELERISPDLHHDSQLV